MAYAYENMNPAPSSLVLISGDRGYSRLLSRLTLRDHRVVVVTPLINQAGFRPSQCSGMYEWSDELTDFAVHNTQFKDYTVLTVYFSGSWTHLIH